MAVRPIDGNELYRIEKLLDTDIVRQDKVALNLLEQVLYDIQHMPTLTPPNEPLTLEQLRQMDGPVWVACKPIEGGNGYWCLCQCGHIITPAGSIFDVKEIPHWVFYRRPPEGEEDI